MSAFHLRWGRHRKPQNSAQTPIDVKELEQLFALFVAAVILAGAARRVGAPYPVFLAIRGALLAFVQGAPAFTVPPELALALFVAPVLLDAAYDTSLRDLRDNWVPVTGLAVFAVCLTTAAVAIVAHALLIYRLAAGAVAAHGFSVASVAPASGLAVAGSSIVGPVIGWIVMRVMQRVQHVPTSIILQFVSTFGVWMLAEPNRPCWCADDGLLRHHSRAYGPGTNASRNTHPKLRRLRDGCLCILHSRLYFHRATDSSDSRGSRRK